MTDFPESDWRVLRELMPVALERFCKRVLDEAAPLLAGPANPEQDYHARYLALYKLIHERNDEMAWAFDDMSRSHALEKLVAMHRLGVLTDEELARLSEKTRNTVTAVATGKY